MTKDTKTNKLDNYFGQLEETMISWRHHIHQNPELGYEEFETTDFIESKLKSFGYSEISRLTKTGLVASISGNRQSNAAIAFRADIDALPIDEKNNFAHKSKHAFKMHACGHDGHTAMLLGAAKYLIENRDEFAGQIHFIFQPAEEGLAGAKTMIDAGLFQKFNCDSVYGLHNWPIGKLGVFATIPGCLMAGCGTFDIEISASGGHAAMPHRCKDAILAASDLVQQVQSVMSRNLDPIESGVISITKLSAGSTYNVLPAKAELKGGFRFLNKQTAELIMTRLKTICSSLSTLHELEIVPNIRLAYPPTINTKSEVDLVKEVVIENFGQENFEGKINPSMGSEDFSYMLEEKPGCYIFLGSAKQTDNQGLHSPSFDFNDEILKKGASYWVCLAKNQAS